MTERTADEIRTSVSNAYANRVRPVLERATATPVAEAACCGPDCCSSDAAPAATIQLIDITPAANDAACCDTSSGDCCGNDAGTDVEIVNIARLYKNTDITDLPSTVTDVAFGCGNPTAIAALQPGETVLDLGSGPRSGVRFFSSFRPMRLSARGSASGRRVAQSPMLYPINLAGNSAGTRVVGLRDTSFEFGDCRI